MCQKDVLKRLRMERGLTQKVAAKAIGISIRTLYHYEHGKVKRYTQDTVRKIAKFYGVQEANIWKELDDEECR